MININSGGNPSLSNTFQQGVNGLQSSSRSMLESANNIVSSGKLERTTGVATDIVEPMINIQKQQNLFDASAKVVQVADEALGALIDIKT